ncbi:MAG: hypothetical protein U5O39_20550 [Gammaproteobacteria bacterium]|nr:hypothetical protein [Gammaproteobacteria bacterium]
MSITTVRDLLIVLLATAVLAGCSSTQQEEPVEETTMETTPEPEPMTEPEPEPMEPRVVREGGKRVLQVPGDGMDYETLEGALSLRLRPGDRQTRRLSRTPAARRDACR